MAIVHPSRRRADLRTRARIARRQVKDFGVVNTTLRALGSTATPLIGWDWRTAFEEAERRFFPNAESDYVAFASPLARRIDDINSEEGVNLIRNTDADVVVCLGGPIYRPPLIEACTSMINFHSGISPIYNGASTIMFAFANGHFRLCGGTLMTMSPVVDGGDILAHYLPALHEDDTPATLFMKTVGGAADVTHRFIADVERSGSFTKVSQPPPLFICTSAGWTVYHTHQVRRHLERRVLVQHLRPERCIDYWTLGSDAEAERCASDTLQRLLGWTWAA